MNATARDMKLPAVIILLAAALTMLLGGGINKAQADEIACTDYELRYNGQIGKVKFPKGNYAVVGIDEERIVCDYALENFQAFLQNFYGKTTRPWVMKSRVADGLRTTTFRRGKKSKVGFSVFSKVADPTKPVIKEPKSCKGSVSLKKGKRIGSFRIPEGSYRVTATDKRSVSCKKSAKQFRSFVNRGRLSGNWKLDRASATFTSRGAGSEGFYITKNVGAGGT